MNKIVYPNGTVQITIAAAESVAVFSRGAANVSRVLGYPNQPGSRALLGVVDNEQTVFGPYASGATIIIDAGASKAFYETGTDPVVQMIYGARFQPVPVALNATGAVTAAAMLGGIVTSTTAAAVAGTMPTGTVMDAAAEFDIGDAFNWSVIATGANAFTVTAAAGHTIVGTAVVATVTSGMFRTVKTAANTFVTYRLA
ncbi:MAG: hypothetical protein V4857_14310 [Pseudomonadota bacterium]